MDAVPRMLACALCVLAASAPPAALAAHHMVDDWFVNVDRDRFAEPPRTTVIAMRNNDNAVTLGVRCIDGKLSLALGNLYSLPGRLFKARLRIDNDPIIDTAGDAIAPRAIEIMLPNDATGIVRRMQRGGVYAIRLMGDTQTDYTFKGGRGRAKALGEVLAACGGE